MRTANPRSTTRDLIHFTLPPRVDRETREELRAILRTHLALESTTKLRQFLVHVLGALGGFLVVCLLFPDATSPATRQTLLWMWALCFAAVAISAAVEWTLHTKEARLLARTRNPSAESPGEDRR